MARHGKSIVLVYNHLVTLQVHVTRGFVSCPVLGSMINFVMFACMFCRSVARPLKLRGSPKASPTILIPKGMLETEGNVLKRVTAVRKIEREKGNPQPSPSVSGLFRDDWGQRASHAGLLVVNVASLRPLITLSPSCAGYVGKVHRLDGGRSQQSRGIRVGLDVLLRLKV